MESGLEGREEKQGDRYRQKDTWEGEKGRPMASQEGKVQVSIALP